MGRPITIKNKKCENCNNEFKPFDKHQRFCSHKCRGEAIIGENHPMWKGENVRQVTKHKWLIRNNGKPQKCENETKKLFGFDCEGTSTAYQYALKHESDYTKNAKDYYQLCCSCHKKYDLQKGWKGSSTSFQKGHKPKWTGGKRPEVTGEKHGRFGKHQTPEQLAKFKATIMRKRLEKINALKSD